MGKSFNFFLLVKSKDNFTGVLQFTGFCLVRKYVIIR